ncbi:MAG: fibronectin type III domain-containing protein, partial [Planctomycetaceae bacterium]|nr:fibronectin type III domain-containing protein [Planctomycetaceae bacterium]
WTQSGYTPGGTYAFRVSAVNPYGVSPMCEMKKATMVMPALPPATPANFVAGAVNTKTVLLTWNAVPWAESYNVYCYDSTVAGGWRLLANVAGTSWTQGGYTPGGTYAFRVSAVNPYGVSPLSETKKATMIAPPLPLAAPMTQALLSYLNEEFLI